MGDIIIISACTILVIVRQLWVLGVFRWWRRRTSVGGSSAVALPRQADVDPREEAVVGRVVAHLLLGALLTVATASLTASSDSLSVFDSPIVLAIWSLLIGFSAAGGILKFLWDGLRWP